LSAIFENIERLDHPGRRVMRMASSDSAGNLKEKLVHLGVRKGSLFIPSVLLLLAVLAFIIGRSSEATQDFLSGVLVPGKSLSWYQSDLGKDPKAAHIPIRVLDGPTTLYGYMDAVSQGQQVTICVKDACPNAEATIEKCAKKPDTELSCKGSLTANTKVYSYDLDLSDGQRRVTITPPSDDKDGIRSCSLTPSGGLTPADSTLCRVSFNEVKDGLYNGLAKPGDTWAKALRPFMNLALLQLSDDMKDIVRNIIATTWQLALFSLIPGLGGLFYRRQFLLWFLATFCALLAINASGLFGSLTSAAPMPFSGKVLLFVAVQALILLAIFRLQRHSQGLGALWAPLAFVTPKWHNRILKWLLIAVGVAVIGHSFTSSIKNFITFVSSSGKADLPESTSLVGALLSGGILGWLLKWELFLVSLPLTYSLFRNSSTWPSRRNKNIVICLDGTSNTPDQIEMGFIAQTNVYKLFDMLESDDNDKAYEPTKEFDASLCKKYSRTVATEHGETQEASKQQAKKRHYEQIGFYYAGVGNKFDNNPVLSVLGMGTGMGAGEIVERAYLDLIRVYRPGDRVFITGFSRGAAIARLLARAIDARKSPRSVWTLYLFGKHRMLWMSKMRKEIPITVLGCWDTVGAFGVAKTMFGINFQSMNMGMDLSIPDNVQQAYHMLALDERRDSFEPTLMDPDPIRPERIVEIWFPGDHANIGGGWATDKLSDVTLDFLLSRISSGYANDKTKTPGDPSWGVYLRAVKADKQDVAVREFVESEVPIVDPEPGGQIRQWVSRLYDYRARTLPLHAVISDAVFERMEQVKPAYAPESLAILNKALANQRVTVEKEVAEFHQTESMLPSEQRAVLEANRKLRLLRAASYWTDVKWKIATRYDIPQKVKGRLITEPLRSKVEARLAKLQRPATDKSIAQAISDVTDAVVIEVVDRLMPPSVVLDNRDFDMEIGKAAATVAIERKASIETAIANATSEDAIQATVNNVIREPDMVTKNIEKQSQLPATVGAGEVAPQTAN
jgi:hypothetical protein